MYDVTLRTIGSFDDRSLSLIFNFCRTPGFEVAKLFSCSTQLSMEMTMLINVRKRQQMLVF